MQGLSGVIVKALRVSVKGMDPAELERLLRERQVFILDVRSVAEFYDGHIPGARHLTLDTIPRDVSLPKDAWLVTVCNRGGGDSEEAALRLRAAGWARARWLKGGYLGWAQAGFADDASLIASS